MLFDIDTEIIIYHITLGVASFATCLVIAILGAINAKRIQKVSPDTRTLKIHKYLSIILAFLITGSFFLELIVHVFIEGEQFDIRGYTGLSEFIIVLIQLIPSLLIKDRNKLKLSHRFFGYVLFLLLCYQLITGILEIFAL